MPKRLGIPPHLFTRPAFYGLTERLKEVEIREEYPASIAVELREKKLDGAFLSPIDYAKEYAMYSIVPNVAVVSEDASEAAVVLFKEHLRSIKTLAVDARSGSEIVLAHLVFAEKYNTVPQVVPVFGSLLHAFEKADAVLLVGDDVLTAINRTSRLDLVDEWKDITGLPFVHGFWVSRQHALAPDEMNVLMECAHQGALHLGNFSSTVPDGYFEHFRYSFSEEARTSISEFYRMAYYHGVLPDIPDIKFHSIGPATNDKN